MPALSINGVTYFAERHGAGRPLLLLHGFTGSSQNWQPLLPGLVGKFEVVLVDVLGHGRSDSPSDESRYTMDRVAVDLITLIEALGYAEMALLGYSMGGRLALFTAVTYPHRFTHLILESTSPGLDSSAEREARNTRDRELADWIEAQGMAAFVTRWEQLPLWASQQQLPAETRQWLHQQRLQNNPKGLANSLRGMGTGVQPSLWATLPTLRLPTLLLAGELDTKFAAINEQMAALLPDVRLQVVSGAGHTVHLERPSAWQQCLTDFV